MQQDLPKHIAVIMDGNGRWAKQRNLPRIAGHRAGAMTAKKLIEFCLEKKTIEVLTLFVFSTENWRRPKQEINYLMNLFYRSLSQEIKKLHEHQVCFQVIGERTQLPDKLKDLIEKVERETQHYTQFRLVIALNYGGRWDIIQATKLLVEKALQGTITPEQIDESMFNHALVTSHLPEPDLLIRTSGENRISNFLLWQFAYTEFYFTPTYWPDFNKDAFELALNNFSARNRRYGSIAITDLDKLHRGECA